VSERIAIERWGTRGPTLLCLHGLGGSTQFFSRIGPALADRVQVVAFDFPGAGQSDVPPAITFDRLASVTVEIARTLTGPVGILGHSMGTIVGLEAIRQAPGLASGLLAVGGLAEAPPDARERIVARVSAIERGGMAGLGIGAAEANVSARTRADRRDVVDQVARIFESQPQDGYVATARCLVAWTARPLADLAGVSCMALTGAEDRYAKPDDVRAFSATLPGAPPAEVLRDCGHLPFLEDPVVFLAVVSRWLGLTL
jgi:pimeloyl-ACP methyl ester carboxylesterase